MTKKERIVNLQEHLKEHPADYQSRISLFKMKSEQVEYEARKKQNEKAKIIAECRRKLDAECTCE